MIKKIPVIFLILIHSHFSQAQQTAIYHDPDLLYKKGVDLFVKEKYSAAKEVFQNYLTQPNITTANKINAAY